jgi:hypothetical protein
MQIIAVHHHTLCTCVACIHIHTKFVLQMTELVYSNNAEMFKQETEWEREVVDFRVKLNPYLFDPHSLCILDNRRTLVQTYSMQRALNNIDIYSHRSYTRKSFNLMTMLYEYT